jgi:hypothetical protein
MTGANKDLVVLTADREMEFALRGILSRKDSLGIRDIKVDFVTHPEHDPGCLLRAHDFLKSFTNRYDHSLVLLDREGCGRETTDRQQLESQIETLLSGTGWEDRAAAVVIDPELEIWIWSDSPHVETILGWQGKEPRLHTWLRQRGYLTVEQKIKPDLPKEALRDALRMAKKAFSSSIYQQIATKVSFERCVDASFVKLKIVLQQWFSSV